MKLHLGCGDKKIIGYLNIDIRENVNPDLVDDISKLNKFKNNSVDIIYACHVLEHFGRREYMDVLNRWHSVLKDGGILRISVPNFEEVSKYYEETKDLTKLLGFLYGGQNYEQNFHYCTWDFDSLQNSLKSLGFKEVYKYNWEETEHSYLDDFSQCYLPHMDKKNGRLMSLNIEAIK